MATPTQLRIRPTQLSGLGAVELATSAATLTVVHEIGPRIASLTVAGGDNLLFWDEPLAHRRGEWRLRGGHRLWVTRPLADESEESYATDNGACRLRELPDGVRVEAPPDASRIVKAMEIRAIDDRTFTVDHTLENVGDMLWSGGAWALTCTRPGSDTTYGVPLPPQGAWDVVHLIVPRRWGGGHQSPLDDPQFHLSERGLVLAPRGRESKRMVFAPAGIVGMTEPSQALAFVKQARYLPHRDYPLATNIALYTAPGRFMVEMETMSPVESVPPGGVLRHGETWHVRPAVDWREAT